MNWIENDGDGPEFGEWVLVWIPEIHTHDYCTKIGAKWYRAHGGGFYKDEDVSHWARITSPELGG